MPENTLNSTSAGALHQRSLQCSPTVLSGLDIWPLLERATLLMHTTLTTDGGDDVDNHDDGDDGDDDDNDGGGDDDAGRSCSR